MFLEILEIWTFGSLSVEQWLFCYAILGGSVKKIGCSMSTFQVMGVGSRLVVCRSFIQNNFEDF
jgi:hypothetical protein